MSSSIYTMTDAEKREGGGEPRGGGGGGRGVETPQAILVWVWMRRSWCINNQHSFETNCCESPYQFQNLSRKQKCLRPSAQKYES